MRFALLALLAFVVPPRDLRLTADLHATRLATGEHRADGSPIFRAQAAVPDSLVMTATWTNALDDGRGATDSLKLRFLGIQTDSSLIFHTRPYPTSAAMRFQIPAAAYAGAAGSATYSTIQVQAFVFRRGAATLTTSNLVSITLLDAAPPGVTSLTITAVKKP